MVFVNVAKGRLLSEGYRPDEVSTAEYRVCKATLTQQAAGFSRMGGRV